MDASKTDTQTPLYSPWREELTTGDTAQPGPKWKTAAVRRRIVKRINRKNAKLFVGFPPSLMAHCRQ
jgi:hypothetical protein